MTRKDYKLIARVLRYTVMDPATRDGLVRTFTYELERSESKFNRLLFFEAVYTPEEQRLL